MVCQAATRNVLFGESIAALMESRMLNVVAAV